MLVSVLTLIVQWTFIPMNLFLQFFFVAAPFVVVQSTSGLTLCIPKDWNMSGLPVLHHLPGVCPSSCPFNWWCHPTVSSSVTLFSFGLQSFSASGSFLNESTLCIRWPKYWSFSFSISISSKYSELISFTIDWFDLLDVHRTLKSLLQHHSLKASILRHSAFFMVQLSHCIGKIVYLP